MSTIKQTIVITLLAVMPMYVYSQKTKTFEVARVQFANIYGQVIYDTSNTIKDTIYYFYGIDARYSALVEIVEFKNGHLYDIYAFLKKAKAFLDTESDGTSDNISGIHVTVGNLSGIKKLTLWSPDKNNRGHTDLNGMQIKKLMQGILDYCGNNNLKLVKTQ